MAGAYATSNAAANSIPLQSFGRHFANDGRPAQKQSGRSCDRTDSLETDFVSNYAARFLRMKRIVLRPNGSSNNAPASWSAPVLWRFLERDTGGR
jgi:hypothetical protein